MSFKDSNKKRKNSNSIPIEDFNNINYLNDDCLCYIFEHLEVEDKLKIEIVCKRWNEVAKLSWGQMTYLDIPSSFAFSMWTSSLSSFNDDEEKRNNQCVTNVLSRCRNLQKLCISTSDTDDLNFSQILVEIPKYCSNITHLLIDDSNEDVFNDENLELIFSKCLNLSSISLESMNLNGNCLSKLNVDQIKEVSFKFVYFESEDIVNSFFLGLKNLNKLTLVGNIALIDQWIDSLIMNQCKDISEIFIALERAGSFDVKNLPLFLSRQKKLNKLKFESVIISKPLIKSILESNLEIFDAFSNNRLKDDDTLSSLYHIKNLKYFAINLKVLNDNILQAICKCKNLKTIKILFEKCRLSSKLISSSDCLQNLEFLELLTWTDKNMDNLLNNFAHCKNLKQLSIADCHFTNSGLKIISDLPNLTYATFQLYDNCEKDFSEFIKKSVNLKELNLFDPKTYQDKIINLINLANEIKCVCGHTNILNIHVDGFYDYDIQKKWKNQYKLLSFEPRFIQHLKSSYD